MAEAGSLEGVSGAWVVAVDLELEAMQLEPLDESLACPAHERNADALTSVARIDGDVGELGDA